MAGTVAIGGQDFKRMIENNCFYIDKTDFIRAWWESRDMVTLITRPGKFGKTLNMSMLEYLFRSDMWGMGCLISCLKNERSSYEYYFI